MWVCLVWKQTETLRSFPLVYSVYNNDMDSFGNISTTLLASFVTFAVIYCIKWYVERRRLMSIFKENGIPSAPINVISSNIGEFFKDPIAYYNKLFSQHGNVFGYFLGIQPTLVVKDLEVLKQVLVKDFNNFRNRPEFELNTKPLSDSVAIVNGPRWKETRSILSPCFSSKKLRFMYNLMNGSVSTFLDIIDKKCKSGTIIDIHAMAEGLSMDVINKCALALKNDCQNNPNDELLVSSQKTMKAQITSFIQLPFIFPVVTKIMLFLLKFMSGGKSQIMVENNLRNVIAFRRKNSSNRFMDMLQLMIDAADNNDSHQNTSSNPSKKSMTDDEIIANAMIFVLAGFGTTSNALGYTFYLLAKHQDVQDKLREEINDKLASDESPDSYDVINSVDYLDQVFNEALRMYPPILTFASRECASTTTINGLTIPKGVNVEVPIYHIHHDPKIWQDPETFDPSRFTADNKRNIHPMAFIPFGQGPRNCIGMRFALIEAKLTICRAIQKYRFVFSEKTEDPLQVSGKTTTLLPAKGSIFLSVVEI